MDEDQRANLWVVTLNASLSQSLLREVSSANPYLYQDETQRQQNISNPAIDTIQVSAVLCSHTQAQVFAS